MASEYDLPPGYSIRFIPEDDKPERAPAARGSSRPVADGRAAALAVYPDLEITQVEREPDSALGRANPRSWHVRSAGAIDARPIPGMTFREYVQGFRDRGFEVIEARNETGAGRSRHSTGDHWHVVLGGGPSDEDASELRTAGDELPAGYSIRSIPETAEVERGDRLASDVRERVAELGSSPPSRPQGEVVFGAASSPQQTASPTGDDRPAAAVRITSRNDPRLAGVNEQFRAMYLDPDVTGTEIREFLGQYGITRDQIPGWDRAMAWRTSGELQRYLRLPANQRGPQTVNLDDIFVPEAEQRVEVASAAPAPPPPPAPRFTGELRAHTPDLAERAGDLLSGALDPVMGRYSANEAGQNLENMLQWTGVGDADAAMRYAEAQQRAQLEGRPLDAAGNQLGAQVSTAGFFPIVGPAISRARRVGEAAVEGARRGLGRFFGRGGREAEAEAEAIANLSPADLDSPIPNDLIAHGRAVMRTSVDDLAAQPRIASGRAIGPDEPAPAAGVQAVRAQPTVSQPARGDLWRLNADELQALRADKMGSDSDKLVQALGEERARRFVQLDRMQNSADPRRADEGSRLFDAEFGNLTPDQERLIYGVGETDAQVDEIDELLQAHSDVMAGDDADWSSYMAAVAARRVDPEDLAAVARGEGEIAAQAAFLRLGRAYENLTDAGISAGEIPRRMAEALTARGWEPDQASEVIGAFVRGMEDLRGTERQGGGLPALPAPVAEPPARVVDRIDVSRPPPLGVSVEEPIGRLQPLGEQPSAVELAEATRAIRPEDVTPIPGNRVESAEEAAHANPGTFRDVEAPLPERMLEMRQVRKRNGRTVSFRGPVDAESYLRTQGGIRGDAGELRHIGIPDNKARPGVREALLGPIVSKNGLTLDEAGEALWTAGYFRERPTTDEVVDMLRASRGGQRAWHPDDLGEVERFEGAQAQRWEAEEAAQEGRPIAEEVGEPIGPDDLDAMEPPVRAYEESPRFVGRVGNLNLERVENPEEVSRYIQRISDQVWMAPGAAARVANEETRRLAQTIPMNEQQVAAWADIMERAPQMGYAARTFVEASRSRVVDVAKRMRGASDADLARFDQMVRRQVALEQQLARLASGSGRTTQQFAMIAKQGDLSRESAEALKAYLRGSGGREKIEDMADAIVNLAEDPAALGRFIPEATRVRKRDMINELWVNGLLSGPRTHIVNAVSNLFTAAYTLPEQALTAGIGAIARSPDRARIGEVAARAAGLIQGAREGLPLMVKAFRTGEPIDAVSRVEAANYRAIPGRLGQVVRLPTRALTASDELFKAINRRAAINAMAYRRAALKGGSREQRLVRYDELRRNPDEALRKYGDDQARYLTFQSPLGKGGQGLQHIANEWPGAKFIFPFVRTPINLLKFAAERNVATAPFFRSFRDAMRAGGNARNEALARVTLGTGLSAWAVSEAVDGNISGGGPSDPQERAALVNGGWQPYSVRIGDRWVSYQRFEPLSMLIGAAADFAELGTYAAPEEADRFAMSLATAVATNITSKTWLSGLSDFFDALSDPNRHGERFVQRLASSAAVPAIVAHGAQAGDPYLREANSILEAVRARVPVVSRSLNQRLNVWGDPIQRGTSGGNVGVASFAYDFLSPVNTRTESPSPVLREVARLRAPIGMPHKTITVDRERVRLTPEQHNVYVQLSGRPARQYLEGYVQTPEWRRMNDDERREYLRETMAHFRDSARDELVSMYPEIGLGLPPGYSVRHAPEQAAPMSDLPPGYSVRAQ